MRRHCFIALVIVAAWLGLAQPGKAQGTIAYYRPDTPIPLFTHGFAQYYPLDMDGDGAPELTFGYDFQSVGIRYEHGTHSLSSMSPFPDIGGLPQPLPAGFSIGSESASGQLQWFGGVAGERPGFYALVIVVNTGTGGQFAGQHAYLGVEFDRAGSWHYGWVLLQISSVAAAGQIEAWTWETRAGVPILAGAVPEPSALALLLGGGVLIVWFRRMSNERRG